MSANENIELESVPASSSDLHRHIKSESHAETINETRDEDEDVATPLLSQPSGPAQIPMSASDLDRMEEIETTFAIDTTYREIDNKEGVSLVGSGDVDNVESQERPQATEMLLRLKELAQDYIEFVIGGVLLFLLMIVAVVVLPKYFHSLYYDEYALARSGLTGRVDDSYVYEPGWHFMSPWNEWINSYVYEPGWHFMSPWNEWIKFYKTAHAVRLNDLKVYTTDQLMVKASFGIYYFLE